ncbi:Phosphate regulon transcriptional regulatory protein PhoB (SphR) [Bathymodiolus heckerae thiotrophic gill symbiont]|uniref:response regulator n=1 Tax=Bathymodiolus heckerae thiotrophic gill symbiont TaxID=1052212 RepID=UPI0010BBDC12|nr:response regulator [Bathymodiolus heckerae thiotrophic gill symbiont]SHN93500.1 Phosphate regulon transcriptional regulatory protein PhoB (SphR) [Bathymodiolus heckerae thiotrophic gill symbiont]
MKKIILIVDDDGICRMLTRYLTEQGFSSQSAGDGIQMDKWLANHTPTLILLDLMLPGEDGLSIARRLRGASNMPIMMLTAKGEDIDRIIGLEIGADDYLTKPFNPRELLARVNALLRRSNYADMPELLNNNLFSFGPYSFDQEALILHNKDREISLGYADTELLQLFTSNPNHPISRDFILDELSGIDRDPFDRSIDVRITRLRKKIEPDPSNPQFIRTVRGVGYRFTPNGNNTT